jgi:hypothetical protein
MKQQATAKKKLAPHTSGPRDVPGCGALSLLQKTLHYRGDPAETAAGPNEKLWTSVPSAWSRATPYLAQSPFESNLPNQRRI